MDEARIQARRARRMNKIYAKRGRNRSKPILRLTTDPETGKKLFQVYGPAIK